MKISRTKFNVSKVKCAAQAAYPDARQIVWKDNNSVWGNIDGKQLPLGVVQLINEYGAVDFFPNNN